MQQLDVQGFRVYSSLLEILELLAFLLLQQLLIFDHIFLVHCITLKLEALEVDLR